MPPIHPETQHFAPNALFLIIPFAIGGAALGLIAWFAPLALFFAAPVLGVILAIGALGNAGVILSPEGIEWYALDPRWRFRKVPWHAVVEVRKGILGIGGRIRLVVHAGRYEPWVWGTPTPGSLDDIEMHPVVLVRGDELLEALRAWLKWRDAAEQYAAERVSAGQSAPEPCPLDATAVTSDLNDGIQVSPSRTAVRRPD
jgi:hypothetical protein